MNTYSEEQIKKITGELIANHKETELINKEDSNPLPDRDKIIEILRELRKVIFPGYFDNEYTSANLSEYYIGDKLSRIFDTLAKQIEIAFNYFNPDNLTKQQIKEKSEKITTGLFQKLPYIQQMLYKDVQAFYDGDPAAKSKEEIIFSYPGLVAIYVYRISHVLYCANVPFIPRIMSEYAHSRTGIDINSGAIIGEYFFIDHGTGIVIGETTIIGSGVKIYQGVTLGGLSTRGGQALKGKKRHPTIKDNVTIYSGATILGGETVIGEDAVIGGNSFITESVPARTKVSIKSPELIFKDSTKKNNAQ
ncbi:MAG: serine acetyltransferase [Clostridia bacterium]|nr:serine acetyltransferase [Clostridia bacterium]